SIRLSLVGAQVGCTTKTSRPRTLTCSSTAISPSENWDTDASPKGIPRKSTTFRASSGLALPVNTISSVTSGTLFCVVVAAPLTVVALVGALDSDLYLLRPIRETARKIHGWGRH